MQQISFATADHQAKKRMTRRKKFLAEMECYASHTKFLTGSGRFFQVPPQQHLSLVTLV